MKKKRIFILIIILILIFIILNLFKSKEDIFDDIMIFSLWRSIGNKNEYIINPQKRETIELNLFNTSDIYRKIAPGNEGQFILRLIRPKESNFKIYIKGNSAKPQNLLFILDDEIYYNIEDMQEKLNNILQNKDNVTINWKWEYDISQEDNIKDTEDGKEAQKYVFEINALIE